MSYIYWIIRYVPNVARGEFTNVGVLCGRDGGDWAVRFDIRGVRNTGSLGAQLGELRPWANWLTRRVARHDAPELGASTIDSGWVAHLSRRQANSIQFSAATPIDVASASEGVNLLFPHLVEREVAKRRRALTRRSLRVEVRDALLAEQGLSLGRDLFVQPRAAVGKERGSFDFLRHEHTSNTLTNVWAFNVSDVDVLQQQVQASNYVLTRLRSEGAKIQIADSKTISVPAEVPVSVVYDPPTSRTDTQWRADVFEAAKEAWELNRVTVQTRHEFHKSSAEAVYS